MKVQSSYSLVAGAALLGGVSFLAAGSSPLIASSAMVCAVALGALGSLRLANQWIDSRDHAFCRAVRWVHSLAFEALAVLGAICLKPFCHLSAKKVARANNDGRPILLVHGYLHDATAWVYQKKKLTQAGLGPVYALNLLPSFSSIASYAQQVKEKAAQIEQETGRSDLILVGHSMGGLVSSWYATQLAPRGKVTDVITIGSPLNGTHLAKIGMGANAREMERGSLFLYELQKAIRQNRSTRFYHIASTTDEIVVPASSAILPGAKQVVLDDVGHLALLYSPRVSDQICSWLRSCSKT